MSTMICEYTFLDQLADRFKIPVPKSLPGDARREDLVDALEHWGGVLVKPDILAGKRGKAGAIREVTSLAELRTEVRALSQIEIGGRQARGAFLVQKIPAEHEVYTGLNYHSLHCCPTLTVSFKGGVDIEETDAKDKVTIPVDIYKGLDAYQAGEVLEAAGCPQAIISRMSRNLVYLWDMFISTGMRMCEVNPWRIAPSGNAFACDFKAVFDEANFKLRNPAIEFPEYPASTTEFEEEMASWSASSHQGQAHVSDLGGKGVLPILFGGGASTIVTETLMAAGGDPMFLSDFGGNPPYERMKGTAAICFKHRLPDAKLLLILGGKANNTLIDVTFQAIADALEEYVRENGPVSIPVIVGRGGPRLVKGLLALRETLQTLGMPHVMFGPDTPVTLVADYAARMMAALESGRRN